MKNELGIYRDGLYRKKIVHVSTGSSGVSSIYDISPDESGALFVYGTGSTITFHLPKISSKALGLVYEFFIHNPDAANDVKVACSKFDSSALIKTAYSSVSSEHTTAIPNSTFPTGGKFTAVSSIVWMLEQLTGHSGHFGTTAADSNVGGWTTG